MFEKECLHAEYALLLYSDVGRRPINCHVSLCLLLYIDYLYLVCLWKHMYFKGKKKQYDASKILAISGSGTPIVKII